jgi:predicted PurR-regulated permease PerM
MTAPIPRKVQPSEDFHRVLAVLVILLLTAATFLILFPFLTAIIWAGTIAVATWPALIRLTRRLGGRRGLAVAVMTLLMLLVFFVPLVVAIGAIVNHTDELAKWSREIAASGLPDVPGWVSGIPVVGTRLAARWHEASLLSGDQVLERAAPWLVKGSGWLLAKAGGLALMTLQFILTAIIVALFYTSGETAVASLTAFARRLGGDKGEELVLLAGKAVRGVALGVVVTALVQALLAGVALLVTGVPAAVLLSAIVFFLCIAQVGPLLVMAPAVGWLYWSGRPGAGTVLVVGTILVTVLDNVLRPILIKKGADLPLLLVFAGVIGGMLTAGLLGIFVGPVVLAVTWTLLRAWIAEPAAASAASVSS